jgi:hypothetical protein
MFRAFFKPIFKRHMYKFGSGSSLLGIVPASGPSWNSTVPTWHYVVHYVHYTISFFNLGARWGWVVKATSRPLHSPGKTRYPLYRRLSGSQGQSGRERKISPPPGFDPRTIQPVASPYIPAHALSSLRQVCLTAFAAERLLFVQTDEIPS